MLLAGRTDGGGEDDTDGGKLAAENGSYKSEPPVEVVGWPVGASSSSESSSSIT